MDKTAFQKKICDQKDHRDHIKVLCHLIHTIPAPHKTGDLTNEIVFSVHHLLQTTTLYHFRSSHK